jgi:hypothetical protein
MDFVLLVFYYYYHHHHHHLESSMAVNENIWCVCHKCMYTQLLYFEFELLTFILFSSPCQRQSELLPSLGIRRLLTFHILIFSSETP